MRLRIRDIPREPYLGFNALQAARTAAACLQCGSPAPCTLACSQGADVPAVMRLVGHAACEGLSLPRWFWDRDRVEAARICDAITEAYS